MQFLAIRNTPAGDVKIETDDGESFGIGGETGRVSVRGIDIRNELKWIAGKQHDAGGVLDEKCLAVGAVSDDSGTMHFGAEFCTRENAAKALAVGEGLSGTRRKRESKEGKEEE